MNDWNGLDFFIFLIFFLNTILGMSRGASKEIISMMCVSAALIITIKFTVPLSALLDRSPLIENVLSAKAVQNFMASIGAEPLTASMLHELSYCISLLVCFVGVFSLSEATLTYTGFVESFSFPYATLNRKVGAGLGFTRGYVFSVILILILTQHIVIKNVIGNSHFVSLFGSTAQRLDSIISGQQVQNYKDIYQNSPTPESL